MVSRASIEIPPDSNCFLPNFFLVTSARIFPRTNESLDERVLSCRSNVKAQELEACV